MSMYKEKAEYWSDSQYSAFLLPANPVIDVRTHTDISPENSTINKNKLATH